MSDDELADLIAACRRALTALVPSGSATRLGTLLELLLIELERERAARDGGSGSA